jgi:short subunit dehydrogenase-like uncharacterized protein
VIADLPRGGVTRRDGALVRVAAGVESRRIDFGRGPVTALSNPWRGDIATAHRSTGIPTITVFTVVPPPLDTLMRASRRLGWLLGTPLVQGLLKRQVAGQPLGPSAAERAAGHTSLWGEVVDGRGERAAARLSGPEAYDFSALTAVAVVRRVLAGESSVGFQTPAQLFGPDFILALPGVTREDVA